MIRCLTELELKELSSADESQQSSEALREAEAHVEHCEHCRIRLEQLAGVDQLAESMARYVPPLPVSASLKTTMLKLKAELAQPSSLGHRLANPQTEIFFPKSSTEQSLGRLGSIEIKRLLGRGGMGMVYEGFDESLHRQVAVKVLSPHLLSDPLARERFLREARSAASIEHENIVTIYSVGETDGIPYLVLRFVAGTSLADRLVGSEPMPADQVIKLATEIAKGLSAAHQRNVVHRDIKPANILLEAGTNAVRIADFGLAKAVNGLDSSTGMIIGTPAFMSPEQANSKPVDHRTDLFSLGSCLYLMLTGELPFGDDEPAQILERVKHQPAPAIEVPSCPTWLKQVVERLLQKDPDARYQSADHLVRDLVAQTFTSAGSEPDAQRRPKPGVAHQPGRANSPHATENNRLINVFSTFVITGVIAMAAYASYRIGFTSIAGDRPSNAVGQDDRTSTGTKQNPPPSFRVAGRSGMHSNLMSAVADADDGDTIEVTHAGPFVQPTIRAFGKELTIKSAAGVKPVFVVDQNSLAFLQTDSSLTLDGLFIECESPVRRGVGEDVFNNSVIACRGESLTVKNCVIRLSRNQIGIFTTSRQCSITNTHVVGDRCRCLLITATTGIEAHIERCVLRGGDAVYISCQATTPENLSAKRVFNLVDNTIYVPGDWGFALGFWHVNRPEYRIEFNLKRNVVHARYFTGFPARNLNAVQLTLGRSFIQWQLEENIFQRGISYLAGVRLTPFAIIPLPFNSLSEFAGRTGVTNTASIEANIDFAEIDESADRQRFDAIAKSNDDANDLSKSDSTKTRDPKTIGKLAGKDLLTIDQIAQPTGAVPASIKTLRPQK